MQTIVGIAIVVALNLGFIWLVANVVKSVFVGGC